MEEDGLELGELERELAAELEGIVWDNVDGIDDEDGGLAHDWRGRG